MSARLDCVGETEVPLVSSGFALRTKPGGVARGSLQELGIVMVWVLVGVGVGFAKKGPSHGFGELRARRG